MSKHEKYTTAVNDVTGDLIKSKASSQKAYADNWERIFGNKQEEHPHNQSGVRFSGMMIPEPIAVFEEEHITTPFMEELLPQGMIEDNIYGENKCS